MENIYFILGAAVPNIVLNYILFRLFDAVYERVYDKFIYRMLYLVLVSVQTSIVLLGIPLFNLICYLLFVILISSLAYKSGTRDKMAYITVYIIYMLFIDIITIPVLAILADTTLQAAIGDGFQFFLSGIVTSILGISTYKIVLWYAVKHEVKPLPGKQEVFILLLGIFELAVIHGLFGIKGCKTSRELLLWMFPGFLILDIYLIYLFESISVKNELQLKNSLLEQQGQIYYRYYENLDSQNQKYRKIMHDIRQHITVIEKIGKVEEGYCRELLEAIDKSAGVYFECTHPILNIVINDKLMLCNRKGIRLNLEVDDIDLGFMKNIDITTIFSNLLDNAIEASEEIEEGKRAVTLVMKTVQRHMVVIVENRCAENETFHYQEGVSHKKGHMGIGLSNVKDVLGRYGAELETERSSGWFRVKFICQI